MSLNAMSRKDEQLLTWAFGPGLCAFERSIQGTLMSRVTNGGHEKCPGCDGTGWVKVHVYECPACTDGFMYPPKFAKPRGNEDEGEAFQVVEAQPYACTRCRVRGRNGEWERRGRRVVYESTGKHVRGFIVEDVCDECNGLRVVGLDGHPLLQVGSRWGYEGGKLVELSSGDIPANPMGFEVRNPPPEPDEKALRWLGVVERRFSHMQSKDIAVLFLRYGVGVQWDRQSPSEERDLGRERDCLLDDATWPVMTVTRLGQRILKRYAAKCPGDVGSIREVYYREFDFMKTWEHLTPPERLRLLTKMPETIIGPGVWEGMRNQAQRLFADATRAWNVAKLRSCTMDNERSRWRRRRKRATTSAPLNPRSFEARVLGLRRLLQLDVRAA